MYCQICGEDSEDLNILYVNIEDELEYFSVYFCNECFEKTTTHIIIQCEECQGFGLWNKVDCYQVCKTGLERDFPEDWQDWLLWWHQAAREFIVFVRLTKCASCKGKTFVSKSSIKHPSIDAWKN